MHEKYQENIDQWHHSFAISQKASPSGIGLGARRRDEGKVRRNDREIEFPHPHYEYISS